MTVPPIIQKGVSFLSLLAGLTSLTITSYFIVALPHAERYYGPRAIDGAWMFTSSSVAFLLILASLALGISGPLKRMNLMVGIALGAISLLGLFVWLTLPGRTLMPIQ